MRQKRNKKMYKKGRKRCFNIERKEMSHEKERKM